MPTIPTTDASVRSVRDIFEEHRLQRGGSRDVINPTQDRQGPEDRQVPISILRRRLELIAKE